MSLSREAKLNVAQVWVSTNHQLNQNEKNKQFYVDMAEVFARWYVAEVGAIE